jgi:drug/metabolite transporter (DMT)-like permease
MRIALFTLLAMLAFAGNSILTRIALAGSEAGPWTFTLIRLVSGAAILALLAGPRRALSAANPLSALALLAYAGFFSFAYLTLPAGTGALILFGMVQVTMIGAGLLGGERLGPAQIGGGALALAGLAALLGPSISAPDPAGAAMMALAGIAWGLYSLRGRSAGNPTRATAGNFLQAAVMALVLSLPVLALSPESGLTPKGFALAVASGALTSGLGYAIWYTALKGLRASTAGMAQLSVPAITALLGVLLLSEPLTLRFLTASAVILGGVALATLNPRPALRPPVAPDT